jgi:hypothetical protein
VGSNLKDVRTFHEKYLGYHRFQNIGEFSEFFGNQVAINLHVFGSNFSYYSIYFVKREYFYEARRLLDSAKLQQHYYPHSLIVFSHIEDKVIIKPNNTFVL